MLLASLDDLMERGMSDASQVLLTGTSGERMSTCILG